MREDFMRYHRQTIMDGWSQAVQERLAASKVFVAGAGGLGCPAALNFALAGVGTIFICDSDEVEITNLNRQFLHSEKTIGSPKTESACKSLEVINPHVNVEPLLKKITHENIDQLVGDAQIIIDCLDNFDARYALNRAAIRRGIPLVHGAVWGMEGRVTVFLPPETPCLECLFPSVGSTGETPVLGGVTNAVGSMQAIEAIRFLAGEEMALKGRILIMDFAEMRFQELKIAADPECAVCSYL